MAAQQQQSQPGSQLNGKTVAILVADGFEQVELTEPRKALENAGAKTQIVSPAEGKVQGWNHDDKGDRFPVDMPLKGADPGRFDALLLPGGVKNPDLLRTMPEAVAFVRAFFEQNKPVAAICHGPWMLVEADVVDGRTLTSWPSLKTDIQNAGASWVDREVVTDNGLVTSRKPDDLPAFNRKMCEEFAEGRHDHERGVDATREARRRSDNRAAADDMGGTGDLGRREPHPGELDGSEEQELAETLRGTRGVAPASGRS
jgi:intracellular protease, PfpI family